MRIPAHSVASTRGNSDRVTAWNRTVARDWRGLFRGPPALPPGCAHLGPHRPLISNVPLGPQQGDCHEEGTGQVRLGGRLGAGPVISPSTRTEVFLQEPRWAVREAGSGRARAGRACVRGAAGGGAGSQRRPWSFAGAHASDSRCRQRGAAIRGGPTRGPQTPARGSVLRLGGSCGPEAGTGGAPAACCDLGVGLHSVPFAQHPCPVRRRPGAWERKSGAPPTWAGECTCVMRSFAHL